MARAKSQPSRRRTATIHGSISIGFLLPLAYTRDDVDAMEVETIRMISSLRRSLEPQRWEWREIPEGWSQQIAQEAQDLPGEKPPRKGRKAATSLPEPRKRYSRKRTGT